ncbi:hypothetical protein MMC10_004916 [Thelotrema lepadinum]|nr:hypothetical protein [Thelotrema lepadinum]
MINNPTDHETLGMFNTEDDNAAEINTHLLTHPIALAHRADSAFEESRPHMKVPESVRPHHLTTGALSGPGRIEVPPLMFLEKEGRSGIALLYIGSDLCGHPGLVHGGAIAALLDETLARCCFRALPSKVGLTANLNINYRKPIPAGNYVIIRSKTVSAEGRKVRTEGTIESLPADGETPITYCEANALYIEPKQAKTMSLLYPAATS